MSSRLDKLLVVDVEATCWMGPPPEGQKNDIIEIGIAELDIRERTITATESIIVLPTTSRLSKFCRKLTTLTPDYVAREGISFANACGILKSKYLSVKRPWASWGDFDRMQFRRQCRREKIKYPFGKTHHNAKDLFSLAYSLKQELSMDKALKFLNIPLEGTHHRGVDDARNIATLLMHALWGNNERQEPKQEKGEESKGYCEAGSAETTICNACGGDIFYPDTTLEVHVPPHQ